MGDCIQLGKLRTKTQQAKHTAMHLCRPSTASGAGRSKQTLTQGSLLQLKLPPRWKVHQLNKLSYAWRLTCNQELSPVHGWPDWSYWSGLAQKEGRSPIPPSQVCTQITSHRLGEVESMRSSRVIENRRSSSVSLCNRRLTPWSHTSGSSRGQMRTYHISSKHQDWSRHWADNAKLSEMPHLQHKLQLQLHLAPHVRPVHPVQNTKGTKETWHVIEES